MKKLLLSAATLAAITSLSAQTSIGVSDFASVGDAVTFSIDSVPPTNLDLGTPGTNKTWNFTSLTETSTKTLNFVDPTTLPSGATFTSSNIAQVDGGNVIFLNKSTSGVNAVGTTQNFNGMSFDATFNPAFSVLSFPLDYLDNINGNYKYKESMYLGIDTTINIGMNINIKIDSVRLMRSAIITGVVDAWGDIVFASGEIEALRATIDQENTDSTWVYFGAPLSVPLAGINYPVGWNIVDQNMASQIAMFDANFGAMLGNATGVSNIRTIEFFAKWVNYRFAQIEVNTTNVPVRAEWIKESTVNLGNATFETMPELTFFPNPTSNIVTLSEAVPAGTTYRIINSVGAVVASSNLQSNSISLANLATGNYTIVLTGANKQTLAVEKIAVVK